MDVHQNHSPSVAESMQAHMEPQGVTEPTLMGRLNERTQELVRERPVICLVGALTVGFVVGKIAARY